MAKYTHIDNAQLNFIITGARIKSILAALSDEQVAIYKEQMNIHKEKLQPIVDELFHTPSLTASFLDVMDEI